MHRYLINPDGKTIGQIEDLMIDPADRTVRKIIVSSGGILTGQSRIELPYRPLGFSAYGLVYDISSEELMEMPGYAAAGTRQ